MRNCGGIRPWGFLGGAPRAPSRPRPLLALALDGGLASLALLLFLANPLLSEKKEPGLRVI